VPDSSGRLRIAAASGVAGLDVIVETVAASVAGGNWSRLKLCSSADCRWAFYDTSRTGGGRWCSMEACGNRNKTRAYRSRRAS
jgi:predicted RNA-binding Zn ribbon-like protein